MSLADYVLLALIIGYALYVIFGRKKHTCCGNCDSCRAKGCGR